MYRVSLLEFERCTKIPHVSCLAHSTFEDSDGELCHSISDNARTDPISSVHYRFGHPSAKLLIQFYFKLKSDVGE